MLMFCWRFKGASGEAQEEECAAHKKFPCTLFFLLCAAYKSALLPSSFVVNRRALCDFSFQYVYSAGSRGFSSAFELLPIFPECVWLEDVCVYLTFDVTTEITLSASSNIETSRILSQDAERGERNPFAHFPEGFANNIAFSGRGICWITQFCHV